MLRTTIEEKRLARQACARPSASLSVVPHHKTIPASYLGAPKVLDIRPLPKEKLTGSRVVPTLTASQWVPFLRFKKPQSRFLGRVLRDKLMQKNKRFEGIMRCDEGMDAGEAQGSWEWRILQQAKQEIHLAEIGHRLESMRGWVGEEHGERLERLRSWVEEGEGSEYRLSKKFDVRKEVAMEMGTVGIAGRRSSWAVEPERQKSNLQDLINAETEKARVMGNKMLKIVEMEKALYEKEKQERRDATKAKRGKGPKGKLGTVKKEPLAEDMVAWSPSNLFHSQPTKRDESTTLSKKDYKPDPGTTGTGRGLEWPTREPKSVDTKLETDEDIMERKLQAMQLSHSSAKSANKKAEPTF